MPAYLFKNPFTQSGRKACNIPHGQTGHVHDQKGRHSVGGRHGSPKTQTWWVSSNQRQESQEGGPWRVWRRWTPPRTSSSGAGMAEKLQGPGAWLWEWGSSWPSPWELISIFMLRDRREKPGSPAFLWYTYRAILTNFNFPQFDIFEGRVLFFPRLFP